LVSVFSLSGYRYLGDGGTDRREILHEDYISVPGMLVFSHLGRCPRDPQIRNFGHKFGPFDREYLETISRSVTCQSQLNISSTRAF